MITATNPLLCNMTVTLQWKCNELIVTQQELLRYYGNAICCIDHVTKENLICHNMNIKKEKITMTYRIQVDKKIMKS
jgi:hypothetical protein